MKDYCSFMAIRGTELPNVDPSACMSKTLYNKGIFENKSLHPELRPRQKDDKKLPL